MNRFFAQRIAPTVALMLSITSIAFAAGPAPVKLQCESLTDPLGVDRLQPRLSWVNVAAAGERGVKQAAYQLLVASSPEKLAADQGDVWDTGRVNSADSTHVSYAGPALASHQRCYWKVRVWTTAAGRGETASAWSKLATWSMGVLNETDWRGQWIGHTAAVQREIAPGSPAAVLNFEGTSWIWCEAPSADGVAAKPRCVFRRVVELPPDAVVKWAYMVVTGDDRLWLWLNGERIAISADEPDAWRKPLEVELTEDLKPGANLFAIEVQSRPKTPAGLAGKLVIELTDGRRFIVPTDATWKASPTGIKHWQQPAGDDSAMPAAVVIGPVGMEPWGKVAAPGYHVGWRQAAPSPVLRKSFNVDKPVRRATAYICGLGYHELHLNGSKVGDHVLDPAFTRYDRRALYVTHDVTQQIKPGANAVGVMLGSGWMDMHTRATWDFDGAPWRGEPRVKMFLRLEHEDGSISDVATDESWRATTGPIWLDSVRAGEVYDARRELPGWSTASYDDAKWSPAAVMKSPGGVLSSQMMEPMRVTQTIEPVKVTEPRPGVFVFDLGQNIAGWVQLHATGPAGTAVTLRYSERLDDRGMIERKEISKFTFAGPFQTDTYILKGQGREIWEPRFTYHGFQYVEVTGYPGKPTLSDLRGRVVHTDFAPAGSFECSNGLLNTIQLHTLWAYRGNYHGYPTDCPHREKNGWTGDAHLAAEQAMFNWHNSPAYHKWIADMADEQRDTGEVAAIIPTGGWGYAWGNGPAWDSALVIIPWHLYEYTGDTQILADNYEAMKRYVDYVRGKSKDLIADFGLGDWAPVKTQTPRDLTSTGYFYIDTLIVARSAKLLGRHDDAARYEKLAAEIRAAFNRRYYKGDGVYANGSQTAQSCAVFQGLADEAELPKVIDKLVAAVHGADDHFDIGILGAKYLLHTLSDHGQHELAYRIVTQPTAPGYADWISKGATTLWEHWDGTTSRNHIMYGDVSAWFYRQLAGIRPDAGAPGFERFVIAPRPAGDLTWVKAEHASPLGPVRSAWQRDADKFTLSVTVPVGATATVHLPAKDAGQVTESGKPLGEATGVKTLGASGGSVKVELGSGEYVFSCSSR